MGFFDFFRKSDSTNSKPSETDHNAERAAQEAFDRATKLLDIDVAIMAHENWNMRLKSYLKGTSTEDLKPEIVCCDDRCDLGKWIYGDGGALLGNYGTFADLKATHKMFHYVASNIVTLHQSGSDEEAQQMLEGSFLKLSNKIKLRLSDMKAL
jgi:hypothetical protein